MDAPTSATEGRAEAITTALLAGAVPDATPEELARAGRYVDRSIDEMPDTLRFGVRLAERSSLALLSLLGRGRFLRLPPDRREAAAARFAGLPLPVVGEYSRLTRGLGLASLYEDRSGVAETVGADG